MGKQICLQVCFLRSILYVLFWNFLLHWTHFRDLFISACQHLSVFNWAMISHGIYWTIPLLKTTQGASDFHICDPSCRKPVCAHRWAQLTLNNMSLNCRSTYWWIFCYRHYLRLPESVDAEPLIWGAQRVGRTNSMLSSDFPLWAGQRTSSWLR